jgi:hypothetical protein
MKNIFLISIIILSSTTFSKSTLELLCYYRFDDRTVNLMEERNPHCEGNVVYGTKEVCFVGNPSDLADFFNSGDFSNASSGRKASNAQVTDAGSVVYVGTDATNFYSQKSEIFHCE